MSRLDIRKLAPKTDDPVSEGIRLALLNTIMLVVAGAVIFIVLWIVYRLRLIGIPLPLPVWLLMLLTGIPYFIIWFQYGKAFGLNLGTSNFVKAFIMSLIGQISGFILYFIIIYYNRDDAGGELIRIISIILRTFIIVSPILSALGSLDSKKG
ncbi:MAG: hypothetical protein GX974_03760 [Clostridiales bacterium]|nr:hypothetical protein [Clostridiales bacterium]